MEVKSLLARAADAGKNLGTEAYSPQSSGLGLRHQRFAGESKPIPMIQNLLPWVGGRLQATWAVAIPPPGN
jgi:hypothetical protein